MQTHEILRGGLSNIENGQQNSILKTRYLGKYTRKRPRNEWKCWWRAAVCSQKVRTKGMTGEKKLIFPKTRPQDGRTQQELIPHKNEDVGGGLPADHLAAFREV